VNCESMNVVRVFKNKHFKFLKTVDSLFNFTKTILFHFFVFSFFLYVVFWCVACFNPLHPGSKKELLFKVSLSTISVSLPLFESTRHVFVANEQSLKAKTTKKLNTFLKN
jgi:hypothetical protein